MSVGCRRVIMPALIACAIAISHLAAPSPARAQPVAPSPPARLVDTTYAPPTGRTLSVLAGADLQAALNAAQPGDVVAIEPGAVFTGNFVLPRKAGSAWITVRSAAPDHQLPSPGLRASPAFSPAMPKLLSPNSNPALSTAPGAHHYRLIALELSAAPSVKTIYAIVSFGGNQASAADTPHDLILDRCYVHGLPALQSSRGVLLNSATSAVIDSHVSEIHAAGYDSQAILGYNGPGPFKIVNNFLEGAGENIMFGGADPAIRGLIPSDIEIRRNHLFKPPAWGPGGGHPGGTRWTIKNLLELKNAQRVLIEGNLLQNMWGGAAIVLTPRNQSGTAPWSVVRDVLIRNNRVENATSGFAAQTTDNERPSDSMKRIAIVNNFWRVHNTFFGLTSGRAGEALDDLLVDHNTAIPVGRSTYYSETGAPPALNRFQLTNNVFGFGAYGVAYPAPGNGVTRYAPGAVIQSNALINITDVGDGQGAARNRPPGINQAMYRSFPNAAAAGLRLEDGTLESTSPLRASATGGKSLGVDFAELDRALAAHAPPR